MKNIALVNNSRFDVMSMRKDFPVLTRLIRGKPLAYLDNGASAQRPAAVIGAVDDYERRHHANIHRGVHTLSQEATGLFACAHVSNALGTVLPVQRLMAAAKARGITTLIDGAQAVPHMAVDVQDLGCDFYAFSGHKMFGPTGIGILYGRESLLERMP